MKRVFYLLVLLIVLTGGVIAQTPNTPPVGITKEKLEARITELKATREQLMANLNAVSGAIQENEGWLKELEKEDKK